MALFAKQMLVGPFGRIQEGGKVPARIPKHVVKDWVRNDLVAHRGGSDDLELNDLEDEAAFEDDEELEESSSLSASGISKMSAEELAALIQSEQLDVDPADYKGRGALSKLRTAVAEAMFGE